MDPEHPTPRPPDRACRPLTASSPDQGKQAASHQPQEELQSVATPGLLIPPFGPSEELAMTVHQAISQRNLGGLGRQVSCYGEAALEVRDKRGMTPLYNTVLSNWLEGAMFLLSSGADVKNSEKAHLCFSGTPFMQLVVKTQDTKLLADVIKRGANIRARDYKGDYCVDVNKVAGRKALFDCLAETVANEGHKRPDLLKDLLFITHAGAKRKRNHGKIERFITRRGGCHQAEMFQVLAACCCCALDPDYEPAFRYWRKSAECMPCQLQSQTADENLAHGSVFADILDVKKHPLPNTMTTRADKLAMDIRAVLAVEKLMPEDDLLVTASTNLAVRLWQEKCMATAIAILWRLTTIRALYNTEVEYVVRELRLDLKYLTEEPAVLFPALLESMKTINHCLGSLLGMHPEASHSARPAFPLQSESILEEVFDAFLSAMILFYRDKAAATQEQREMFPSEVKNFIQTLPWAHCEYSLHVLASERITADISASMIKVIVTYSAEAFGTKRQENSPPHLVCDENGNTVLHTMAMRRSHEDLVQEGVLQCFLDHGAHLCTKNKRGQTVRSILVKRRVCTEGELLPSLQCLAAVAFMGNRRLRQTVGNCRPTAVKNFLLEH